jgi:hypothetical protein
MGRPAPAHKVDGDGEHDDAYREGVHVDYSSAGAYSLNRLNRDADRQCGEKAGLG